MLSLRSRRSNDILFNIRGHPMDTKYRFTRKLLRSLSILQLAGAVSLLAACGIAGLAGPYPGVPEVTSGGGYSPSRGPVPAPQVGYRIDENRYFEIVPAGAGACSNANLFYVDKAKGIRELIEDFDDGPMIEQDFAIDAANDQYLIAPISRGNINCSSGGGYCTGSTLPYSTDAGRTWQRAKASSEYNLLVSGSNAYVYGASPTHYDYQNRSVGAALDLTFSKKLEPYFWVPFRSPKDPNWTDRDFPYVIGKDNSDWRAANLREQIAVYQAGKAPRISMAPLPRISPLDTKFHCSPNGKE